MLFWAHLPLVSTPHFRKTFAIPLRTIPIHDKSYIFINYLLTTLIIYHSFVQLLSV